jgi:hypothetical protein
VLKFDFELVSPAPRRETALIPATLINLLHAAELQKLLSPQRKQCQTHRFGSHALLEH